MTDPLDKSRDAGIIGRALIAAVCFIPALIYDWELGPAYTIHCAKRFVCPPKPTPPAPPVLSPRAQKLYDRLLAGEFYTWGDDRTPKAMDELQAAGLVGTMGRVTNIVRCWVPAGSEPLQVEKIRA